MVDRKKLMEYLEKNLKKGYTIESLKWSLIKQGYSRTAVDLAIEKVHEEMAKKAPVLKTKPIIIHEIFDENDNPIKIKKPWWRRFPW